MGMTRSSAIPVLFRLWIQANDEAHAGELAHAVVDDIRRLRWHPSLAPGLAVVQEAEVLEVEEAG